MTSILDEAKNLVREARQDAYGHPLDNFTHTAELWSAYLGTNITFADVATMMVLVKISREKNVHLRDNLVDIAGYADALNVAIEELENRREPKLSSKEEVWQNIADVCDKLESEVEEE